MLKDKFKKACDVVLMEEFDLEQVLEDQDPEYLARYGVKRGIAQRFLKDIGRREKRYKV